MHGFVPQLPWEPDAGPGSMSARSRTVGAMPTDADLSRRAVYAAEDRLATWLDAAASHPERHVTIDGVEHRPEIEPRFSDVAAVQTYVDTVLAHLRDIGADFAGRERLEVRVRERAGARKAVYERGEATIAIPPRRRGGAWSLRGLVVLHELAHHLDTSAGQAHGPAFQATLLRLLEELGMRRVAGLLHDAYVEEGLGAGLAGTGRDDTLAKIGKLLRQAEGTRNEHERDAFLARAQSLATRHSVALAVARAAVRRHERRESPVFERVVLGEQGKRSLARYVQLMSVIRAANDLSMTISAGNSAVTLYGFAADIEVTKALYASLVVQMIADGDRYLRSGAHKREISLVWEPRRGWVEKAVDGATARAAFYEGWTAKVGERLREAKERQLREAVLADGPVAPGESTSTELAVRAKELEVVDYFQGKMREHNVRGTWRGTTSAQAAAPASARAGAAAAARAVLGRERALG